MKRPGTWIAVVSLAMVALFLMDTERTSPGPLALVHAREIDITSATSCDACHGGIFESMAHACMECHVDIDVRIDAGTGVHGQLAEDVANDCGSCHREHHGPNFRMVDNATFALAGIPDMDEYTHEGIDYNLVGAHEVQTCESCHPQALASILAAGRQRFLGVDQSCTTCHEDSHEGAYGNDCMGCHGQDLPFPVVGGSAHSVYCPAEGAHVETDCLTCHVEGTDWSVEALVERHLDPTRGLDARTCDDCHSSPHSELFVRSVARLTRGEPWERDERADGTGTPAEEGALDQPPVALAMGNEHTATVESAGLVCARCHSPTAEKGFLGEPEGMTAEWHRASGFALEAPHDQVGCAECHPGIGERMAAQATPAVPGSAPVVTPAEPLGLETVDFSAFVDDYPGRGPDACHSCHGDPHEGQFEGGPFGDVGCLGCHEKLSFEPPLFDAEHHDRADFVLEGSHRTADCNACHLVPEGRPERTEDGMVTRQFAGTGSGCAECHPDPHSFDFLDGVRTMAALAPSDQTCTVCHDAAEASFVGEAAALTDELHAASGFELIGAHGEVQCAECHQGYGERKVARAYGTGLGRHADAVVKPSADIELTASALALGLEPGAEQSLDVSAVLAAAAGKTIPEFHPTGSMPDAARQPPRLSFSQAYPGRAADGCQECHSDPHEDQFERGAFAGESCLNCHTQASFQPSIFDEELHARTTFPLTGSHLAVGCNECHQLPDEIDDPQRLAMNIVPDEARIFVDTPDVCSSCHEDVHDGRFDSPGLPARVEGRESCARCHVTDSFAEFQGGRYDHGLWSGFLLEGAHGELDCTQCHVPTGLPDEFGRAFGSAAGTQCSDCHQDNHVGQFAVAGVTDCERCHIVGSGFDELVFDHQVDSNFPLDENHIQRRCDQCHVPYPLIGGGEAVRYKPLGTECRDCHDPRSLAPDDPRRAPR